jgi:transcriptional/translational regulatory protein YebC/TACO1
MDIEALEMDLIDGGLEEMEVDDEYLTLYTAYEDFGNMVKMLEAKGIECESAELQRIPNTTRSIDEDSIRKVLKVINILEEDDDVTNVFHDMEIPDDFEEE